jgi:hypothetical protein
MQFSSANVEDGLHLPSPLLVIVDPVFQLLFGIDLQLSDVVN